MQVLGFQLFLLLLYFKLMPAGSLHQHGNNGTDEFLTDDAALVGVICIRSDATQVQLVGTDYQFNLEYGKTHTNKVPVAATVRELLDIETKARARLRARER